MDIAATVAEIRSLSVDDRLDIVEAIWDSIVADADDLHVSPAERELIEERLAAHRAHPTDVVPWEQVKAEALERARALTLPLVLQRARPRLTSTRRSIGMSRQRRRPGSRSFASRVQA